ncbi:hypothetical protein PIB19_10720 [Sphingomonas sp. 7/4-4]|uniref:hypothetical protein n=1 Tax=Sphingomonas sp. 7/4-4 TaxID=3018446 RepID=UPI0022F3BC79|nr:hypothetical protein [Sphingomonas sp. 7/4-4]WBY09706.1 hypothetical protein PIB19_10720 [Sphingomonas sp. 7/4-4]
MTRNQLLCPVMLFDAATCLAMGGLLVAAAGPIAGLTELPVPLLREAGILLFPFALFVLWAARQGAAGRCSSWRGSTSHGSRRASA